LDLLIQLLLREKKTRYHKVNFKQNEKKIPIIKKIQLISRSGYKRYVTAYELKTIICKNSLTEVFLSTDKGILTANSALKKKYWWSFVM